MKIASWPVIGWVRKNNRAALAATCSTNGPVQQQKLQQQQQQQRESTKFQVLTTTLLLLAFYFKTVRANPSIEKFLHSEQHDRDRKIAIFRDISRYKVIFSLALPSCFLDLFHNKGCSSQLTDRQWRHLEPRTLRVICKQTVWTWKKIKKIKKPKCK